MLIGQMLTVARTEGIAGLVSRTADRLLRRRSHGFLALRERLAGRRALEIGGPSACFRRRGYFPVYPLLEHADNCNFASETIWEGPIAAGRTFEFDADRPAGRQFIAEATDLSGVDAASYDLVLSSHTIEHTGNPIRALSEWRRVLTEDGLIVLIAPHRDGTFDHRRPVTALAHLIEDFRAGTGEDDATHLPEILRLHDRARDPGGGSVEDFRARSEDNLSNRALHHHVFDTALVEAMLRHAGFRPLAVEARRPYNIVVVAEKATAAGDGGAPLRFPGPFPSDRDAVPPGR